MSQSNCVQTEYECICTCSALQLSHCYISFGSTEVHKIPILNSVRTSSIDTLLHVVHTIGRVHEDVNYGLELSFNKTALKLVSDHPMSTDAI